MVQQHEEGASAPEDLQRMARELNEQLQEARLAGLGDRAAVAERIRTGMPPELAQRAQWLLWRLEADADRPGSLTKPLKTPYWTVGRKRAGQLGGAEDRRNLQPMEAALRAFTHDKAGRWNGVGFAFLEGDGLIGIDLDWKDTGEPSAEQQMIMDVATSFCEWSPSGVGVHIIVAGQCESFKHDDVGVEVYCGGRYFTCTGQRLASAPPDVRPIKPHALAYMQQVVQGAKDRAKAARRAAAEPAAPAAAAPAPRPAPGPAPSAAAGDDFRRVNAAALESIDRWVSEIFPAARDTPYGWRVTSKDLGRNLQEDLQLSPDGIWDFGEEEGYSAIDCVLRWAPALAHTPKDAMLWLADRCGVQVQRRGPRAQPVGPAAAPPAPSSPAAAPDDGAAAGADVWDDAAADAALDGQALPGNARPVADAAGGGGGAGDPPAPAAAAAPEEDVPKPSGKKAKVYPPEFWDAIDRMLERYALVYGSNQVWDLELARFVEVPHLRLACGTTAVNFWLASTRRRMVYPEDLVFEPGADVPDGKINLFQGVKVAPVPCNEEDVAPMLRLLRHLCGSSVLVSGLEGDDAPEAGRADDVDAVMHWVLSWQAYPHQHLGAKMRTALIFHGSQGTGKNLFFDAWRDTFGELGKTVGQTELEEKYNAGWLSRTLAIVGDEVVSKAELYHNKNRLKMIVTQEHRFPIRAMHCDVRYETNHANVVFTSNEDLPLALEDRDRRYLVVYTPLEADPDLYDEVKRFLLGDGIGKWLHYLQNYELGDFDRHTKPLMTRAKQLLIEANWKPTQRFVAEWIGGYLDLPRRACSREQIFRAFRRWAENTGVKWTADQATFVREINRWANEQRVRDAGGKLGPPPFEFRKVRMPSGVAQREVGEREFVQMLIHLPGGPTDGVAISDWSIECIREFGTPLNRYCGHTGRPSSDANDGGET